MESRPPRRPGGRVCAYFNRPGGCNRGSACAFAHVRDDGAAPTASRPAAQPAGFRAPQQHQGGPAGSDSHFGRLLHELGCCVGQIAAAKCQQLVVLALRCCDNKRASRVLQALKSRDGANFLAAVGLQAADTPQQLLGVLVPVLALLVHEEMRDPLHSNAVLAALHNALSLQQLAAQLESVSNAAAPGDAGAIRQQLGGRGGVLMPCLPVDWLDVLAPLASFLGEVVQRFRADLQQPQRLQGAQQLLAALTGAAERHLPPDGPVARGAKASDWRRLLAVLSILARQLHAQQEDSKLQEQLLKMREAHEQASKRLRKEFALAVAGPGELRPGGPRHDNDKLSHLDISVHPTRDEVLCTVPPFLPNNRPGSIAHAAHDPDRAHRELHFRLLRHDLLAPISAAAQAFLEFEGVAGLNKLQGRDRPPPGCSVRLHLKAGRDWQDLYVFRNVAILGLTSTFQGAIGYRIEFDDVPQLAGASLGRRREWWSQTKQLQHGSLVALWWDGSSSTGGGGAGAGSAAPLPHMMFATVCDRDINLLVAKGEPRPRPQLSIKVCGAPVTKELMAAVLGRQRLGGQQEVVLLPASGAFFAYEPILAALQASHPLPLARYILLPQQQQQGAASAAAAAPVLVAAGAVEVPAYIARPDVVYDLTPLVKPDALAQLGSGDISRLQRVHVSAPGGVPLELLQRATSLDASQARALAACLTQELALVQGPPGTGKTFIGIELVRLLLANTRGHDDSTDVALGAAGAGHAAAALSSNVPVLQRPQVGPILVLCFTNHALDSFLEGLLGAGIRSGIIRVGGRSKSEALQPFNLREQEQGRARGAEVGRALDEVKRLKAKINSRLEQLKASRQARRLRWEDLAPWLQLEQPALFEAFAARQATMDAASFAETVAGGGDGFQQVSSRKKKQRRRQARQAGAGAAAAAAAADGGWVWGEDPLQDWLQGCPDDDALRKSWLQALEASWQQAALGGLDASSSTAASEAVGSGASPPWAGGSSAGSDSGASSSRAAGKATAAGASSSSGGGGGGGTSSNAYAALELMDDGEMDLAELQALVAGLTGGGGSSSAPSAGYGGWMQQGGPPARPSSPGGASDASEHAGMDTSEEADADDAWQLVEQPGAEQQPGVEQQPGGAQPPPPPPPPRRQQRQQQQRQQRQQQQAAVMPAAVARAEQPARSVDELLAAADISGMSRAERQRLYKHWLDTKAADWGNEVSALVQQLEDEQRTLAQLYDRASCNVLKQARIIGMTTTGLANKQALLHQLQPKIIIVEEAAEVLEAHVLTSLTPTTEHLILIGDHLQLPPKAEVYELQQESGRGYNLNVSLFERLVQQGTVQHVMLEQQRRMRPCIADLIRGPLYPAMRDHAAVTRYAHVRGMTSDLFFWDHDEKEGGQDESRSKYNAHEVEAALGLARYLLQQGYGGEGEVTILTPYVGQLLRLKQAVEALADLRFVMSDRDACELAAAVADAGGPAAERGSTDDDNGGGDSGGGAQASPGGAAPEPRSPGSAAGGAARAAQALADGRGKVVTLGKTLRLATIDNFQGEEARVVFVSLVRNPRQAGGGIGFLAVNNRINVLLSRAKEGMYLLGSSAALQDAADKAAAAGRPCMWSQVLEQLEQEGALGKSLQVRCQRHGAITDITHPQQFRTLVGDGGCQQACGLKLPCGHTCSRRCHADDPQHSQTQCLKRCSRLCTRGRHACQRLCHEPCNTCAVPEEQVELPCGHVAKDVPCHKAANPSKLLCKQLCSITMPGCGHTLTVPCHERSSYSNGGRGCSQAVRLPLPGCGHELLLPCSKAAAAALDPTSCSGSCGGLQPGCEHTCSSKCGDCMALRLAGGSSSSAASPAAAAAAVPDLLSSFLEYLQQSSPQLHQAWLDWRASAPTNLVAAARSGSGSGLWQLWRRFIMDALLPALGTSQCAAAAGVAQLAGSAGAAGTAAAGGAAGRAVWERLLRASAHTANTSRLQQLAHAWQAWLLQQAAAAGSGGSAQLAQLHAPCKQRCEKQLACGHACQDTCHHGANCSGCRQECVVSCEHSRCHLKCAEPCAPCAEPCGWRCEHQGPCLLPCGVPCDRLPCNERCSKVLVCGHRCPGLCGEACPAGFCVHPACKAQASEAVKGQVVDIIMLTCFEELTDADVAADPLVVTPTRHPGGADHYTSVEHTSQQCVGRPATHTAWPAAAIRHSSSDGSARLVQSLFPSDPATSSSS